MKCLNKKNIKVLILQLSSFLFLYLISLFVLSGEYYLFNWTAENHYAHIWVLVIIFTLWNKKKISNFIVLGNAVGIIIGQLLGDYILVINQAKITPATPPHIVWSLVETHKGFQIWILILLLSLIAGVIVQKLSTHQLECESRRED